MVKVDIKSYEAMCYFRDGTLIEVSYLDEGVVFRFAGTTLNGMI